MRRDIPRDLRRFGGLARRSQLLELGTAAHLISAAVATGELSVPRRGWVSTPDAPSDAVRAVVLGGILGGSSALRSYGIWVDGTDLVVSTSPTASRLPDVANYERRTWMEARHPSQSGRLWRVSVIDALLQHATMVQRPSLIASIDSALHQRLLTPDDLATLALSLPESRRGVVREVDGRSMSGTESKLRIACVAVGLRVELQASISRVGYVDLLIDGWLIVEVDSRQFHDEPRPQHRDRVRDGNAVLGSFGNLRFDYQLVQFDLDWCIEVILARLKSGRP